MLWRIKDMDILKTVVRELYDICKPKDAEWLYQAVEEWFPGEDFGDDIVQLKQDVDAFMETYPTDDAEADDRRIGEFEDRGLALLDRVKLPQYVHMMEVAIERDPGSRTFMCDFYGESEIDKDPRAWLWSNTKGG